MFKFTLLKNLYYELDPDKMPGVKEVFAGDSHFRTLFLSLPEAPDITSITMQENFMPYVTLYRLYLNDEKQPAEIDEARVRILLTAFYRKYFPEYLKEDAPEDREEIAGTDLLTILDPDKMPGYQKKYAMRELLTVEDLRSGKTGDEHKSKVRFPGMSFAEKYKPK